MEKIIVFCGGFLFVSAIGELFAENPAPWAKLFLGGQSIQGDLNPKRFKQIHVPMTLMMALLLGLMPFVSTNGLFWIIGTMILVLLVGSYLVQRYAFKKRVLDR